MLATMQGWRCLGYLKEMEAEEARSDSREVSISGALQDTLGQMTSVHEQLHQSIVGVLLVSAIFTTPIISHI